jgi:hypothetical protein
MEAENLSRLLFTEPGGSAAAESIPALSIFYTEGDSQGAPRPSFAVLVVVLGSCQGSGFSPAVLGRID